MRMTPTGDYGADLASIREEPYQADIMKRFGIRGVIGGRHGAEDAGWVRGKWLRVFARHRRCRAGVGRAHHQGAQRVFQGGVRQRGDLGVEVAGFPAVVTVDSHNKSLYAEVAAASQAVLDENLWGRPAARR